MKVVHIIPGSGGTFYCQNCMRDNELIKALRSSGHDIFMVPMYLPLSIEEQDQPKDTPIFYGAINMYLKELFPAYRHAPMWLERIFNSRPFLKFAAKKSGSTRASGLEEMTISMLMGEHGRQSEELDHLIRYLKDEIKPDAVHISNALLLGLAHRLKNDLGTKVLCSLQDENEWIDPMSTEYRRKVWDLMADKAADVDVFVATSVYYASKLKKKLRIPEDKMRVIPGGINLDGYERSRLPFDPPVIGYLCRLSEYFGLGILIDAFITLKQDRRFKNIRLHLTGGYTGDDQKFVKQMMKKLSRLGFDRDVEIFEDFSKEKRIDFLRSLTVLSVPVPTGEAFGTYQVEALAAGVPIVQPNVGGYPEFVEATNGGIIYEPNTGENLADALASLLEKPERIREMGERGHKAVIEKYSIKRMADNMIGLYEETVRA